jgi:TolB-like protein/class 3 adenylate cyclase
MERKLAAILAADVVGYSALMEADEAGTFERLRAGRKELFEPEINKHHGHIFKLMGDGLLAEFGSVVDAVECAVTLQRGMTERNASAPEDKRIEVRIGVNLGEVIVEGDDRYGEGVNVAARLQQLADPGGICVSGKVSKEVEKKLAFGFEPMGEQKVKNIAEPVPVYRVLVGGATARRRAVRGRHARAHVWATLATVTVALILAGISAWYFYLREPEATPSATPTAAAGAPIVAVLPFSNMSSDAAMGYFADGVTETLIAGLSRSPNLRVIARTSTDAYKGKAVDIRQIGRELGAQYVLEGSVQKGGDKLRIVAQLINAISGEHVWAERYDREGSDALELQDEVTEKIIGSLAGSTGLVKKKEYERAWGKDSASLEEYDHYLRGHQLFLRFTKEDTLQAITLA